MTFYRGFEVIFNGASWGIWERGILIDDAATDVVAEDKINLILTRRYEEDRADDVRNYRR